ncbi:MAG: DNA cytosine methyltransferase, partial [Pirellulaceae bacterium]
MPSFTFTEFFCGIGGLSACLPNAGRSVAIDINQQALEVYQLNFSHQTVCKTIESLAVDEVTAWPRELWWMSPP